MSKNFEINDECYIAGYPERPDDLSYALPGVPKSNELKKTVLDIFHDFESLIFSPGGVKNKNQLFIDIDCSSTSGMSGSPLISNGKVIGVYVGGPPLPCQKLLMDFSYAIMNENIKEAEDIFEKINYFREHIIAYEGLSFFRKELWYFVYRGLYKTLNAIDLDPIESQSLKNVGYSTMDMNQVALRLSKSKLYISNYCFDSIYESVILFPEPLNHNSSISVEHPMFNKIELFLDSLKGSLPVFTTVQGLISDFINRLN